MIQPDTHVNLWESDESITCNNNPHSANQGMITSDSLLPPSEPPDIKNWFSSYENKSLVLVETNDNFGFSDHQDFDEHGSRGECSTGNTVKSIGSSRELVTSGINDDTMKKTSSMLIKCKQSGQVNECQNQDSDSPDSPLLTPVESEPPGIENWFSSYAYESPVPDDMDKFILPPDYKENMVVGDGKQWKEVEKAENLSHVPSDEMNCHQILKACDTDNGSTEYRKNSTELPNEGANVNSPKNVNQMSSESPEAISLDATVDGDGFVSIKSKSKREKYNKSMCEDQKRASSYVSKMKKGNESAGRKILGDVTNIDEHSGKWKCPGKRKPDIGPPLKQLRLGQWFHYA